MGPSNLSLCYEGIQRVYRNAIVRHVRSCLKKSFPADYFEKLKKPFEKEWDKVKESSLERRRTGELTSDLIDEFDVLGVDHFFNLFEVYDELRECAPATSEAQKFEGPKR